MDFSFEYKNATQDHSHSKRQLLENVKLDPLSITIMAISGCLILLFLGTIIYTVRKCIDLQNKDKVIII